MTNPTHPASGEALSQAVRVVTEWVDMASEATAQPPLAVIKHVAICQSELDALRTLLSATPSPDKLKIAIEALETIAEEHDAGRHDGLYEACPAYDAASMFGVARAALSALKGEGKGQ